MGCCNEPVTTLTGLPSDPAQHVNYERGMVLGVDDFRQEFAYHDGRDHWLARDAIGYGTLSGLRVMFEAEGADGPRLHVAAGSALTPGGRMVCVPVAQCAVINRWLARPANAELVNRLVNPASPPLSPPPLPPAVTSGDISLYLTLCHKDCTTRLVPIPGEPCRSEDELMKPSRVADDFCLELRESAPKQVEEDALRDFVRWLHDNVSLVESSPPVPADEAAWQAAMRGAAQPWFDAASASPPLSPPASVATLGDYLTDLSPSGLAVAPGQLDDLLRVALRSWVTELRPLWAAMRCHTPREEDVDCVLLARVSFEVTWSGGSPAGAWQISGSPVAVEVDESTRPVLAHARLLKEWLLAGDWPPTGASVPYTPGGPAVEVGDGGTGLDVVPADGEMLIGSGGGYALALLSGTLNQVDVTTAVGSVTLSTPQDIAPTSAPVFGGLTTTGAVHVALLMTSSNITLDETHHVVVCKGGQKVELPRSDAATQGRTYIIKSVASDSTVLVGGTDVIDGPGASPEVVKKQNAKTFVADGNGTWHLMATVV